jgi:hypothetical protein
MHAKHKKRAFRFALFFAMMLLFAVIEDVLAAQLSGATLLLETIPIIVLIAFLFTLVTELVEEHFESGDQPLERLLKTLAHLEKHEIPPTYENIRKHLRNSGKNNKKGKAP